MEFPPEISAAHSRRETEKFSVTENSVISTRKTLLLQPGQNSARKNALTPYATLDMWRGIACLCVVLYHSTSVVTGRFEGLASLPLYRLGNFGYLGVQMFFVISGYCIAGAACSALRRSDHWGSFMLARLRRVFPPLWFSLILIVAFCLLAQALVSVGLLHSSLLANRNVLHLSVAFYLSNLTLTQLVFHQPFLSIVCWTLCYEIAFYLLVSMFLVRRRAAGSEPLLLTGLHCVTLGALALLTLAPQYRLFPLDLWPQFGLGIVVYDVLKHPNQRRPQGWLLGISLAFLLFVFSRSLAIGPLVEPSRLTFGFALVFALLLLFLYPYDDALGRPMPVRWLVKIGLFSYSLYLTHFLTLGLVNQASRIVHLPASAHCLLLAVSFAVVLLTGRVFFQFCERPFLKETRKPKADMLAEVQKPAADLPAETKAVVS